MTIAREIQRAVVALRLERLLGVRLPECREGHSHAVGRAVARWLAILVAILAGAVGALALRAWIDTAWLPYNSEGRYFDAEAEVVYTDDEPEFWGVLAFSAVVIGGGAGFLAWKLRRRRAGGDSSNR